MTTLYRPVLIESAEQAEALPLDTVALGPYHQAATRVDFGLGWAVTGDEMSDQHAHLVGWTALVPIEAEEETRTVKTSDGKWHYGNGNWTRYVTRWEAA